MSPTASNLLSIAALMTCLFPTNQTIDSDALLLLRWLVMGPCIVEIDRIVIREVQYKLEVNRLKGNYGWVWPMWAGRPRVDCRIVIRLVQYQLEVNRCRNKEIIVKGNFGWVLPTWSGRPRVGNWAMHKVQCQLEVNRCRNEEVIVKGNFVWVWPMWVGRLRVGNGAMHIEIDRIVIREFQYQFEVNRYRNEEIIVKGNFGWVWSNWVGRPRIYRIVIREFQGSMGRTDGQANRRTDGRTAEITTISPRFSKSVGITTTKQQDKNSGIINYSCS
ncbi:hypothetical protein DPMN_154978 [Dreissena polymorpha]|uniref:Uncharacterized protein n=1 Tax=Dreissena polymorpha TaxID=45954 RepID=A0A9D4FRV0_DREPO|nr:hypothetical protein DPMN_154978 [Dreissena polymorpha]